MAELVTIARPYAEAAFGLAKAQGKLQPWSDALAKLAALAADAQMRAALGNPNLTGQQKIELLLSLAADIAIPEVKNFVTLLVANQRLTVLPEISEQFEALKQAHDAVKPAQVISAFPLSDTDRKALLTHLEKRFGSKIEATISVDPELIGGVTVQVGDEVLDASVRGKLAAMATALKS